MAGALLGYIFCTTTVFAVTTVLFIGLFDDTKLGNTRHHPRPIIARIAMKRLEAHRQLAATSVTKQASTTKDTDTSAMASSQEAAVAELGRESFGRLKALKALDAPPRLAVLDKLGTLLPTR